MQEEEDLARPGALNHSESSTTPQVIENVSQNSSPVYFEEDRTTFGTISYKHDVKLPCLMLEYTSRNPEFVGREKLLVDMARVLLPSQNSIASFKCRDLKRFVLSGLGGIGKTEIAIEFTLRHKDKYDAIFWIRADETQKMDARFSQIAAQLGFAPDRFSSNCIDARVLVHGWLSGPWKVIRTEGDVLCAVDATWLVVFDNADDLHILPNYWPYNGNGSVIVTSRDPLSQDMFGKHISGIELPPLSLTQGVTLLKRLSGKEDDIQAATDIVNALCALPLAITQMAGVIRLRELELSEFVELYPTELANFFGIHAPLGHSMYPHTLLTVWALDRLALNTKVLLQVVSMLDPSCIQEDIFANFASTLKLTLPEYPESPNAFGSACRELMAASLIQRLPAREEWTVHPLVLGSIQAKMSDIEFVRMFWNAVLLIRAQWPIGMTPMPRKGAAPVPVKILSDDKFAVPRSQLFPHVLSLKNCFSNLPLSTTTEELPRLEFAELLNDAAWYQFEQIGTSDFNDFWNLAQALVESSTNLEEQEQRDSLIIEIHYCLGAVAAETNDHESSRAHKRQTLDKQLMVSKRLGLEDIRMAIVHHEWSIALIQDGRYDEAITHIGTSLEIEKTLGLYPYNWDVEANLGLAYIFKGDLDVAEEVLIGSLKRMEERHGKDDVHSSNAGRLLQSCGRLRAAQERWDESYDFYKRAYMNFEKTLGDRSADVLHMVAEVLIRREGHEEALECLDEALDIWELDKTVYRQEIARTTFFKGSLLCRQGQETEGELLLRKACALRSEITKDGKDDEELGQKDFDDLVTFWSK